VIDRLNRLEGEKRILLADPQRMIRGAVPDVFAPTPRCTPDPNLDPNPNLNLNLDPNRIRNPNLNLSSVTTQRPDAGMTQDANDAT
jgi:hypothetical protein